MNSNITDRTFWSNDGWFLNLRKGDENVMSFVGNRRLNIRSGDFGVIAGPFNSLIQMENWFTTFQGRHGKPRDLQMYQGQVGSSIDMDNTGLELMAVEEIRNLAKNVAGFHFG
jgi:hypothetical protein